MFTHICVNFTGNKVHAELVRGMARIDERHSHVFVPCKSRSLFGRNDPGLPNVTVTYFYVPAFLRYFQLLKIGYSFLYILILCRRRGIDLRAKPILAHTFWSDGVLAYLIDKVYRCGYVLTVRSTDVNVFFRYGYHLRSIMRAVGAAARAIVSPNAAYIAHARRLAWLRLDNRKLHFIPNPIPDWWYESIRDPGLAQQARNGLQGCFVGEFSANKNIRSVVQACQALRQAGLAVRLACVGGTAQQLEQAVGISPLPDWIEAKGRIHDRRALAAVYRQSRFLVVPSFRETFGMVYLEALSQGCIIIYSRGQAVDGIFDDPDIQYRVDPHSVTDIRAAMADAVQSGCRIDPQRSEELLDRFKVPAVVATYRAFAQKDGGQR